MFPSHIKTRQRYDFLLYFPHKFLMSFLNKFKTVFVIALYFFQPVSVILLWLRPDNFTYQKKRTWREWFNSSRHKARSLGD